MRKAGQWLQDGAELVGSLSGGDSQQGYSVALSNDGTTALVGGPYDNNRVGAVWVWTRSDEQWTLQAKLSATDYIQPQPGQGINVSLSADGNTAAIASISENAIWIWTRSGTEWSEQAKLVGAGGSGPQGYNVALSSDGGTLIDGGFGYLIAGSSTQIVGSTYVFTRAGDQWAQQGGELVDANGQSVSGSYAISGDGNTALIGSSTGSPVWTRLELLRSNLPCD